MCINYKTNIKIFFRQGSLKFQDHLKHVLRNFNISALKFQTLLKDTLIKMRDFQGDLK